MEFYIIYNENGMDFGPYKNLKIAKQKLNEFILNDFKNGNPKKFQYSIIDQNGDEILKK